ncbi:hypothetical protein Tco_0618363 [Tanacetum coccineum]
MKASQCLTKVATPLVGTTGGTIGDLNMLKEALSFDSLVNNNGGSRKVKFRSFETGKHTNDMAKVQISLSSVLEVYSRFGFSLYGYFMGKRITFLMVENYVKNTWKKYGIVRVMMDTKGFFFFKFASIEGMNEDGLSAMDTKLSTPLMLDSYTSWMCFQLWGRLDYACALIDINADRELKSEMIISIPNMEDDGETPHTVRVE